MSKPSFTVSLTVVTSSPKHSTEEPAVVEDPSELVKEASKEVGDLDKSETVV